MDFTKLLNTITPFGRTKLKILEQLVNVFYNTTNDQESQTANQLLE